ncbi:SAF domain-containing protein [Gordonia sp. NPDC003424]
MQLFVRDSLSPRIVDRVRHALRPGWMRSVIVRRTAAVALIVASIAMTVAGHRSTQSRSVVVSARDLMPGQTITASDLAVRAVPGGLIPSGALRLTADGVGRTAAGHLGAGEIVTSGRLLSSRLPIQLTRRDDARLVPVRLSDDSVVSLLREGDLVDVLAGTPDIQDDSGARDSSPTAVLARNAVVALTTTSTDDRALTGGRSGTRPVLLAMDEAAAHRVAAAGLDTPLAVVLH